jgi:TET-Associated Glycosyltransferase
MLIAIPSRGRPDWKKQVTLRNFIEMKCKRQIALCIPEDKTEGRRYRNNVLSVLGDRLNMTIEYVPNSYTGISHTRKWILTELAAKYNERYVLMLDDDQDFCYRPDMADPALETIKDLPRFESMFQILEQWLEEGFVHVGLAARQGSNNFLGPESYRDVTRMNNSYAYNTEALKEIGVELGRIPVMEDFDLTLQLLRKGYPNRVSYQYVWNQRGSGAEGGCSSYRTAEMQSQAALKLKEYHPDYVSVVTKTTGTVWKDFGERDDVVIRWQEAYKEGTYAKATTT